MKIFKISQPWDFMVLNGTLVFTGIMKAEEVTDPAELSEFHKNAIVDAAGRGLIWNEGVYKVQCKTAEQALKLYYADMAYDAWATSEAYKAAEANHD